MTSLPLADEDIIAGQGRLAENLRRLDGYRDCRQIFVDPSLLLRQVRINALLDGKKLVMPAAGLKEGFCLLEPFTIPFKDLPFGVTYKGLDRYCKRLFVEDIPSLEISMLVGEAYGVDRQGVCLGDGLGFFDLAVAILGELGGLGKNCQLIAAIDDSDKIIEEVPGDEWDVRCNAIVSPAENFPLPDKSSVPAICWEALPMERVKRISPLWRLYNKQ
ncbi:MAG: 5-formyltetrahydrofolate cyclo-ligase [Thermodesulfobacteriota bacterium]